MKHIDRIIRVEVAAMLREVLEQPDAWTLQTGRQERSPVHRETRSIPIRGIRKSRMQGRARRDVHETRWTKLSKRFPHVVEFLEDFARREDGSLGRARMVLLPPDASVHAHRDRGAYYRLRDRFHLVLRADAGCTLRVVDESA